MGYLGIAPRRGVLGLAAIPNICLSLSPPVHTLDLCQENRDPILPVRLEGSKEASGASNGNRAHRCPLRAIRPPSHPPHRRRTSSSEVPETLGGLALFAALLVPGFVYLERRESRQAGQQLTPLRETGQILFVSLACDSIVIGLFAVVRWLGPGLTPDVGEFVREGGAYGRAHYRGLLAWGLPSLGAACVFAALVAVPPRLVDRWVGLFRPDPESPSRQEIARRQRPRIVGESGWSAAFFLYPERSTHLGVTLQDGSYLYGRLLTHNPEVEETGNRSLILAAPIQMRCEGSEAEPLDADSVVISAEQIRFLTVSYLPKTPTGGLADPA